MRRYLAVFGPETARDVLTWCGLTKLSEVLPPDLVRFAGDDGRKL